MSSPPTAVADPLDFLQEELTSLVRRGLYRSLREQAGEPAGSVAIGGRKVILLCSNNYLGLATHPWVKEAAKQAIDTYGAGSGASRLVSGNSELYQELEERLARLKGTEAAIVFASGYAANVGTISALVGRRDAVYCDRLNHASIYDACLLSRADIKRYPHGDTASLERLLRNSPIRGKRLIVSDGVFSMDGDIAPLMELVRLAEEYSAILMVDDAHGTGVLGDNGAGTVAHCGLEGRVPVQMGTLSKALGGLGGFVAGSQTLVNYLVNKARPLIYSTALPPPVLASCVAALNVLEQEPQLQNKLAENAVFLRQGLFGLGFCVLNSQTPIIPVVIGDPHLTMQASEALLEEGVFVQGIRPPTVPEGKARLRVTVMATHKREELSRALEAFGRVGRRLGLIR